MIEANNPEIDVDELMVKIREEVAKRQLASLNEEITAKAIDPETINYIEALLNNAEAKAQIRTELPGKLNRFPFNLSKPLQKFALRVYAFLFKEQRAINFSLIQALRESAVLNRQLIEQVTILQSQLQSQQSQLLKMAEQLSAGNKRLSGMSKRLNATENCLSLFLEEARKQLPDRLNQEQLQTFVHEGQHLLDAFYAAFEEQFRGSCEDIRNRLKVYLPLIEKAQVGTPATPILDLGCGRGEWLELLHESGYTARGIDINRVMIEECAARGLQVNESEMITHLQSLPDSSLGVVTGFHIIEHFSFPNIVKLLYEVQRVLKSGGITILETPNPQNILVGSHNFYLDPTHQKPLPSPLTKFLLENTGFHSVEVMNLNPYEDSYRVKGSEIAELFNSYFYGPQDYAVVGYKV